MGFNQCIVLRKFAGWEGGKALRAPARDATPLNLAQSSSAKLELLPFS